MDRNDDWLDPQLAWKDLCEAYAEGNLDDMEASAGELLDWLAAGGAPPQTGGQPPMDDDWNRVVAEVVCRQVLCKVSEAKARTTGHRDQTPKGENPP